jgi:hypothetical protein
MANNGAMVHGDLAYASAPISIQYPRARIVRAYYEQVFAAHHVATRVTVSELFHMGPRCSVSLAFIAMGIAG